jgi:hypothetical protein
VSSRTTIDPLSITDGKISNQAKINPKKVAPADEASFLITQNDRKYQPKKIHGDGTIDASGKLTITSTTSTTTVVAEEEVLPPNTVKIGPSSYYHGDTNVTKAVGEGPSAIPVRDTSGNLKAETADLATNATTADSATTATTATTATNADNADLLDSQEGTHYLDVTNHTAGTSTSLGTPSGSTGLSGFNTSQTVPKVVYTSDSAGTGQSANILIPHNFGYYPQVTVMSRTIVPDSSPAAYKYIECDVEVENEITQTKIHTSEQGLELKIILS